MSDAAERLARRFHELYEEKAPEFGYVTRDESRKPWEEVPKENRALMISVCYQILTEGLPVEGVVVVGGGGGSLSNETVDARSDGDVLGEIADRVEAVVKRLEDLHSSPPAVPQDRTVYVAVDFTGPIDAALAVIQHIDDPGVPRSREDLERQVAAAVEQYLLTMSMTEGPLGYGVTTGPHTQVQAVRRVSMAEAPGLPELHMLRVYGAQDELLHESINQLAGTARRLLASLVERGSSETEA